MHGIVYLITNISNGKKYVGQTTLALEMRWKCHLKDARSGLQCALHCAIRKYGIKAFNVEQIDSAETLNELNNKEVYHVLQLKTLAPNGYNLTAGGDGHIISEETRQKLSSASLGRKMSEETIKKMAAAQIGKRKIFCKHGHLLNDESIYVAPGSKIRRCLVCHYLYYKQKLPEKLKKYAL